jgi:multimeric flavodoxin WrbA
MEKTAILIATSNGNGNTMAMVKVIAEKINATVFDLQNYDISAFDYQHNNLDDDFIGLVEQLLEYDQIVFATPVYWYTMCAQMKVFFDRLSDLLSVKKELGRKFRGKYSAVISTGSTDIPERSFEEVFINSFNYLGMSYKGMIYCYCENEFTLVEHESHIEKNLTLLTMKN